MFKIAALSDWGWIDDPASILNYLMTTYLLSDAAQSLLFEGKIISLSNSYHQHINDPDKMAIQIRTDLTTLLSRNFETATVECTTRQIEGSYYGIVIKGSIITDKNERVDLSRVMEISTSSLRKVIQVNNYGDGLSVLNSL